MRDAQGLEQAPALGVLLLSDVEGIRNRNGSLVFKYLQPVTKLLALRTATRYAKNALFIWTRLMSLTLAALFTVPVEEIQAHRAL
jgi:hypothetical protein